MSSYKVRELGARSKKENAEAYMDIEGAVNQEAGTTPIPSSLSLPFDSSRGIH